MHEEPRWYGEPWAVGVFFVLLPPLGFLTLWFSAAIAFSRKLMVSLMLVVLFLVAGGIEWQYEAISASYRSLMSTAYRLSAEALGDDDRHEEAEQRIARALELAPLDPENHLVLGICLLKQERSVEAARSLGTARRLALGDIDGHGRVHIRSTLELLGLRIDQGKLSAAQKLLDELHEESSYPLANVPRYRYSKARLFAARHDWSVARAELRQLIDEMHTEWFGRVYEQMALVERGLQNETKALYFLCEALRYREGERALENQIISSAEELDLELAPFHAYLRGMRLRRHRAAGEATAALLTKIVQDHPDFLFVDGCLYTAAYCLFYHERDYHRAAKLYERVARDYRHSESRGKAMWQAALCYKNIGLPKHRKRMLDLMLAELPPSSSLRDRARFALRRDRWRAKRRKDH